MSFRRAQAIADAVLLEGYVLYPYRATSNKNQYRWTFGVLAPKGWSEAGGCEPWWIQTECLLVPGPSTVVEGRLRFFQIRRRPATTPDPLPERDGAAPATWDEGDVREIDFAVDLTDLDADGLEWDVSFTVDGSEQETGELVSEGERDCIDGMIRIAAVRVAAPEPLLRLRVRVENVTPWNDPDARREVALRASCVSTHLLLRLGEGTFLSTLDPPVWAEHAALVCENVRAYPVLAGPEGEADLLLSAPIALYDHPRIAPESPGDFHDATEIDELLALRTLLLTDEEKAQARATDPRSAAIVDRVEAMPPEVLERLHGAVRHLRAAEMVPRDDGPLHKSNGLEPGTKVRLCPGTRRTDAQDLLFTGQTATIEKVLQDVDGRKCFAVTLDADPAAPLHRWYGRFHYYYADEIEPLVSSSGGDA